MKFLIDQKKLDEALKCVQFGLLTRPSLPVLNNVHLKVENDYVTFTLTDLEISISCQIKVDVEEEGETTLAARKLISIVRRLPDAPIELSTSHEDFVSIRSGEIHFSIQGIPATEFPLPFEFSPEIDFSVEKETLHKMLINTSFATSTDQTRIAICGPLLKFSTQGLSCIATDGKRLAIMTEQMTAPSEGQCIIPPKTNNALLKLMAGDGDVIIAIDEKHICFNFTSEHGHPTTINSQLITSNFPNYAAIIPDGSEYEVAINRQEFLNAMKRMALILTESDHGVKLDFNEGELVIRSQTQDDESQEDIKVQFDHCASIAFNPHYLIEPLKRLSCEEVTLRFSHSHAAASLSTNDDFLYVLMPMRM